MLISQIIFFVQSNIVCLGLEVLPVMQQMLGVCITHQSFDKMEEILICINYCCSNLKRDALVLSENSIRHLFAQAQQHAVPTQNTSDLEKTLIKLNTLYIKILSSSLEEIGIEVLLSADNAQMIEPLIDWLSNHFYYGWEQSDKK